MRARTSVAGQTFQQLRSQILISIIMISIRFHAQICFCLYDFGFVWEGESEEARGIKGQFFEKFKFRTFNRMSLISICKVSMIISIKSHNLCLITFFSLASSIFLFASIISITILLYWHQNIGRHSSPILDCCHMINTERNNEGQTKQNEKKKNLNQKPTFDSILIRIVYAKNSWLDVCAFSFQHHFQCKVHKKVIRVN